MLDRTGRTIEYLRISVTGRCDLRCVYCMPENGVEPLCHGDILSYEEILRIARLMVGLGVKKIRLTGGEPLVRKNLPELVRGLKSIPGIERVCLTTNGILLSEQLPELKSAGLDSVNISLDALGAETFKKITRRDGVDKVLQSVDDAVSAGLSVKINCVPTALNESEIIPMAERFLPDARLSLRFIELMPIGLGQQCTGISPNRIKTMLTERFGALTPLEKESLAGPCEYFAVDAMPGKIGFISAVSNCFCASCNRVRLTSTGFLKTCLQFDEGAQLKPLLSGGDEELLSAIEAAILAKPERHLFSEQGGEHLEKHTMSQIGG